MLGRGTVLGLGCVVGAMGCHHNADGPEIPLSAWGSPELNWGECPSEWGSADVQCTQVEVPLDWTQENDEKTAVLLRRMLAPRSTGRAVWGLDGGPGFAGDSFFDPAFSDRVVEAGSDLYVVSHRGVAGPFALRCPSAQTQSSPGSAGVVPEEWASCLQELKDQWGEALAPFSVRQAARDVEHLMGRVGAPLGHWVFGGSYGTLWAQRVLLDTNAKVEGALLDSLVPFQGSLERADEHADRAAAALLEECTKIEACAKRFEGDPLDLSRAAMMAFDEGSGCGQESEGWTRSHLQEFGRKQLDGAPTSWVRLVSFYEKLARCSEEDRKELSELLAESPSPSPSPAPVHYNPLLNRHLLFRELYRFEANDEKRLAWEKQALVLNSHSGTIRAEADQFGPGYRRVEEPLKSSSSTPVLLISGMLDPLDPPEWGTLFLDTMSEGEWVQVPWAGHSVLRYADLSPGGCADGILAQFFAGERPEVSCLREVRAPDF